MFTKKFWIDTAERVIVTMAQAAIVLLGLDNFTTDLSIDFGTLGIGVLSAGVLCVLKCLIASRVGSPNTAALLGSGPDTNLGRADQQVLWVVVAFIGLVLLILLLTGRI